MDTTNYCTSCGQSTKHTILFSKTETSHRDSEIGWSESYEVIECKGCENKQFRKSYTDETMLTHMDEDEEYEVQYSNNSCYPNYLVGYKQLPNIYSVPTNIRKVYIETVEAFKANCYLLAGVGFRAIIEAICLEEKITGRNLEIKISNLLKNKYITEKEAHRLHSIRFLGNDSVHEMDVPSDKKLHLALEIIEHLLKNIYIIDVDAKKQLDTIITNFEEFKELLWKSLSKESKGVEKSIKEILNKNYRRLELALIPSFNDKLISEINSGNLKWLSVGSLKPSSKETNDVQHFIRM